MKWLDFKDFAPRDKKVTIRATEETVKKLDSLTTYLSKREKQNISQADLFEKLINVAWNEMKRQKKRG